MSDNVRSAAYSAPAWHGKGYVHGEVMEPDFAYKQACMDYEVEKREVFYLHDGMQIADPRHMAMVRTDTGEQLGLVGRDYQVYQNIESLDFVKDITASGIKIDACGVLGVGERIWFLGKVPGSIIVDSKRNDVVDQYLLFLNGHNGLTTAKCMWTPIRVVCQNTERAALKGFCNGVNGISIRHTSSLADRMTRAQEILGLSVKYYEEVAEAFTSFNSTPVNRQQVGSFLDYMFKGGEKIPARSQNIKDKVTELFESGTGNYGENAWHLYNGYTEWYDYHRTSKETEFTSRDENRFDAVLLGGSNDGKAKAFSFIADEICGLNV